MFLSIFENFNKKLIVTVALLYFPTARQAFQTSNYAAALVQINNFENVSFKQCFIEKLGRFTIEQYYSLNNGQ